MSGETSGGIVPLQPDRIKKCIVVTATRLYRSGPRSNKKCKDPDSGGRMTDNIITNTLWPELPELRQLSDGGIGDFARAVEFKRGAFV